MRGTIGIIIPLLQILGGRVPLSPRDLRPWVFGVVDGQTEEEDQQDGQTMWNNVVTMMYTLSMKLTDR